jgi:hypothetical protein
MNPPGWVLRAIQSVDVDNLPRLKKLRKSLKNVNNRELERTRLPAATRAMLREHFAQDIERLGSLLGRDLGHWIGDTGQDAQRQVSWTPSAHVKSR